MYNLILNSFSALCKIDPKQSFLELENSLKKLTNFTPHFLEKQGSVTHEPVLYFQHSSHKAHKSGLGQIIFGFLFL